jgi:Ulp1 family protease
MRRKNKTLFFIEEDILECAYFLLSTCVSNNNRVGYADNRLEQCIDLGITAMLVLTIDAQALCDRKMKNPRIDTEKERRNILLQFEDDQDFEDLLSALKDSNVRPVSLEMNPPEIDIILETVKNVHHYRHTISPSKRKKNPFSSSKEKDEILLVYPFPEEQSKIEEAAIGLTLFSTKSDSKRKEEKKFLTPSDTPLEPRQRMHSVTIRVQDYDRLESEVWLNDSLVDLFMLWISRDIDDIYSSQHHIFTSHFYSTLTRKGVAGVTSWTAKKDIDIFDKKLIFIPINKSLHWSLCVVFNPGAIDCYEPGHDPSSRMPGLLCFDSLEMHCPTRTKKHITEWLNSEWSRLRKTETEPFNSRTFQCFTPQGKLLLEDAMSYNDFFFFVPSHLVSNFVVPLQDNGSDCGVYVCRYSLGLYQLRHCDFTEHDVFPDGLPQHQRLWQKVGCEHLIATSGAFDFNVQDIQEMRREFQHLLENLSKVYGQWQKGIKRNSKLEKRDDRNISTIKEVNISDATKIDTMIPPLDEEQNEVV